MAAKKLTAMSLIVLTMMALLAAEVRAIDELNIGVKEGMGSCIKRCDIACIPLLAPPRIAACAALCILACKLSPPAVVMDCTTCCTNSTIDTYKPTYVEKVNDIVGSCYKTCKHNNL
ncbi:hypothetical protein HRI_004062600 [Hibiscus trionum]|uniref:Thionin-like protein n=1 Tax=Hibiscus trionum TaxID=183268 RepID=A0A9W7J1X9_HIBTR|nr:hypothetical protein HRI_004062100 [Hibiscus trionum]GMJ03934.1 hypothetical protein HRI_004062600 [Hibiscus trionum]